MASLADPLRGRDNALNFLRLMLAVAVIVDHSVPLSGLSSPRRGPLSDVAVDGFFVLSGYLVSGSRVRMSGPRYAWHRALRILPGLWVCLLVTALVIAPLATLRTRESWSIRLALGYVAQNATLYSMPDTMGHTLAHVPLPGAWNGSLWTLWYESLGYLAAGLLLWSTFVRRHAAPILLTVAACAALVVYLAHGPLFFTTNHYREAPTRLACFFAAGMALWALRERLPSSGRLAVAALTIAAPLYVLGALDTGPHPHVATFAPGGLTWMYVFLPLPLGYLLLWLGGVLPVRLGVRNDISYGVYIYAWPVQQVLAVLGGQRLGLLAFTLLAVALTVPMAWLSWTLVEKRVLRLKDLGRTTAARVPA